MKKLLACLLALAMLTAPVFAAESVSKDTHSYGGDVKVELPTNKITSNKTIQVVTSNELDRYEIGDFKKASSSAALPTGAKVSNFFDLRVVDGNGNETHEGATVTFDFAGTGKLNGVKAAGLVHVINGTNTYEIVPGTINGDKLTVTLGSTSPVAFWFSSSAVSGLEPVVNTAVK